jgi:hypothetical protein
VPKQSQSLKEAKIYKGTNQIKAIEAITSFGYTIEKKSIVTTVIAKVLALNAPATETTI